MLTVGGGAIYLVLYEIDGERTTIEKYHHHGCFGGH